MTRSCTASSERERHSCFDRCDLVAGPWRNCSAVPPMNQKNRCKAWIYNVGATLALPEATAIDVSGAAARRELAEFASTLRVQVGQRDTSWHDSPRVKHTRFQICTFNTASLHCCACPLSPHHFSVEFGSKSRATECDSALPRLPLCAVYVANVYPELGRDIPSGEPLCRCESMPQLLRASARHSRRACENVHRRHQVITTSVRRCPSCRLCRNTICRPTKARTGQAVRGAIRTKTLVSSISSLQSVKNSEIDAHWWCCLLWLQLLFFILTRCSSVPSGGSFSRLNWAPIANRMMLEKAKRRWTHGMPAARVRHASRTMCGTVSLLVDETTDKQMYDFFPQWVAHRLCRRR
jgi:hypothetical protein